MYKVMKKKTTDEKFKKKKNGVKQNEDQDGGLNL